MSALLPKADMCSAPAYVCFGPKADMSSFGHRSTPTCVMAIANIPNTKRRAALKETGPNADSACALSMCGRPVWRPLPCHACRKRLFAWVLLVLDLLHNRSEIEARRCLHWRERLERLEPIQP